MATFHVLNFGCRASQADGSALRGQLRQAGFREAGMPEVSDIAVLNTCTVTAAADAEVRQVIRRIHRANPACRILVTGCYAQRASQEIAALEGVQWVVGNSHKHAIAGILSSAHPPLATLPAAETGTDGSTPALVQIQAPPEPQDTSFAPAPPHSSGKVYVGQIADEFHFAPALADDRTRPTLKIQDGCNARCSFCIIPAVRGESRSLAPERVVEEVRRLVDEGYKEVVLSGINLGSYGKDLAPRLGFLSLLERLLAETAVERLRISSIEPMDVTPALIQLVSSESRMARHFHVPLQSGCDRVLRLMNRRYWSRQYEGRVLAIREAMPDAGIGADVMVGFPGETGEDHEASLRFIESLPFTYVHIFPYSRRPATPAAESPGQINGRAAQERAREIRAVITTKRRAFLDWQIGRTLSVVTLHQEEELQPGERARLATSTNYLKVVLPGGDVPGNVILPVHIGRTEGERLYGYPIGETGADHSIKARQS